MKKTSFSILFLLFLTQLKAQDETSTWTYMNAKGDSVLQVENGKNFNQGYIIIQAYDEKDEPFFNIIDSSGVIKKAPSDIKQLLHRNFSEGLIAVVNKDEKVGVMDVKGKIIVPMEYTRISFFSNGLASVSKNGKYGYINKNGKVAIELKYDQAGDFENGFAPVMLNEKELTLDKTGKIVPNQTKGVATAQSDNEKWAVLDNTGKPISAYKYATLKSEDAYETGRVLTYSLDNKTWGLISFDGKELTQSLYDAWGQFDPICNCAMVEKESKFGVIDAQGKTIVPFEYIGGNISEGMLRLVNNKDAQFYLDKTGKRISEKNYDEVGRFSEGLAPVSKDGLWGFIDKTGKEIIALKYANTLGFSEGLAAVESNKKTGFIDAEGKEIIPFQFDHAASFVGGLVILKKGEKNVLVNKKGKIIKEVPYHGIANFESGLYLTWMIQE
jgi:WG containing repeat